MSPKDQQENEWHTLNTQITKEQYQWLNAQRFKRGKSLAFIVRELLDKRMKREE